MDQQPKARKPKGKPRVPNHLRPIVVNVRMPPETVAWLDSHRTNRSAVILGLIRAARGAKP